MKKEQKPKSQDDDDDLAVRRSFERPTPAKSAKPRFRRVLLKLSGETLGGPDGIGICPDAIRTMAQQIAEVRRLGVQVVVVVGGGNIYRGASGGSGGIERATGDYMGMLA